jgi:hypothetical protein
VSSAAVVSRVVSTRGLATRLRLREGLRAATSDVVCRGVLCSAVSVGSVSARLDCRRRCAVMPRCLWR